MAKIALITGASRGIGKVIAEQLSKKGIRVFAPTRQELNLASNDSIDSYLASLTEPVDILVNNAGINYLTPTTFSDDELNETLQVNMIAPIKLTCGLIEGMKLRKYGRVVNISSVWSIVSRTGRITYSVSKTGLNGFTRSIAVEVAPYNILVNAAVLGYVNTEMTKKNNNVTDLQNICKTIPMRRLAEPIEIAHLVSFLCSEDNSYITGQCVVIDGGYSCL